MSSYKLTNFKSERNQIKGGTLYLVATPIGNLADLSERAIKVLSEVDFIAAEDTRNSVHILTHLGIRKPLISYFEHNKRERGEIILSRIEAGESCALITDAGTPAISDPGEDIVKLCSDRGVPVTSIPGCCAAITALTLSALSTGRFCFEGFVSFNNKNERRERLSELSRETRTMIFYEAPHRLRRTLSDFSSVFGENRRVTLCRELTKLNEQVLHTTFGEACAYYETNEPRGEYVLVVEGYVKKPEEVSESELTPIPEYVDRLMKNGMSKMEAIKSVAKERGVPKNTVYKEVVSASRKTPEKN